MAETKAWLERPRSAFKKPSAEQRLDAILRLATEMFNKRGVGGTALDDLADGLGIRKASLYNYVKSKNDLVYQCLMRSLKVRANVMDKAEQASGTAIEKLEVYLDELCSELWGPGSLYPIMVLYEYTHDYNKSKEGKKTAKIIDHELDRLKAMIELGQEDGSIRAGNVPVLMHAFEAPLLGLVRWYEPDGAMPGHQIHAELNQFTIEGLRSRD